MAKLIYVTNASLDGFIEDEQGDFQWSEPDDELFTFFTEFVASVGTFLYGRRLYESMAVWETDATLATQSDLMAAFADAWQSSDKIVYSTTLDAAPTARTRIERTFDPAAVRDIKASATSDLAIGGAHIAAQAFAAGLVDECHLAVHPVLAGGGKPALSSHTRAELELLDHRRFNHGVLYLRYAVRT